jgi:hypothetical protein
MLQCFYYDQGGLQVNRQPRAIDCKAIVRNIYQRCYMKRLRVNKGIRPLSEVKTLSPSAIFLPHITA